MDTTVIEVKDLVAGYEGRVVLKEVSFTVTRGETFVVLGGSGCGKSTLLKHMIGLHPLLGGEVRILHHRIQGGETVYPSAKKKKLAEGQFFIN